MRALGKYFKSSLQGAGPFLLHLADGGPFSPCEDLFAIFLLLKGPSSQSGNHFAILFRLMRGHSLHVCLFLPPQKLLRSP